jgi:hypothetical protein
MTRRRIEFFYSGHTLCPKALEAPRLTLMALRLPLWWQWTVILYACLTGFLEEDSPVETEDRPADPGMKPWSEMVNR